MNREIKFRAWIPSERFMGVPFNPFDDDEEVEVDGVVKTVAFPNDAVFMQFTGLHDKNGKEIYEGDIILEGITRKIIVWENGAFHVRVPNYEPGRDLPTRPLCFDMLSPDGIRFEIIGNIYQNPELIKLKEHLK